LLYEYRRYTVKPGQMDELHRLMTEHVIPVLQAAGTTELGYWTGQQGDDLVYDYLLAFRDRDHHASAWQRLGQDATWRSVKQELGDAAPWATIESTLLSPTAYSPAS
jgi:hypothetical protein